MTFVRIDPVHPRRKPDAVTIRLQKSPKQRTVTMVVTIGSDVLAALGWQDRARVTCLWGQERDFGWVLMQPSDKVGFKLRPTGAANASQALSAVISTLPSRPLRNQQDGYQRLDTSSRQTARVTEHKLGQGGLLVRLPPEWFGPAQGGVVTTPSRVIEIDDNPRAIAARLRV